MIVKDDENNEYVVACDGMHSHCSNELFTGIDDDDFDHCLKYLRRKGWKDMTINGKWEHFCPVCLEKRR